MVLARLVQASARARLLRSAAGQGYARRALNVWKASPLATSKVPTLGVPVSRLIHHSPAWSCAQKPPGDGAVTPPSDHIPTTTMSIKPMMQIAFTCNKCKTRVFKTFSKHAYTKGLVIITCPGCKAHHLIADNIGWFKHFKGKNIEEILADKGEAVKRLRVSEDGTMDLSPDDQEGFEALRSELAERTVHAGGSSGGEDVGGLSGPRVVGTELPVKT